MLRTLSLLLPALVPSWRFFDVIAPSPRIEFRRMRRGEDLSQDWQEFRPRPQRLSFATMVGRLFWNPRWNESLYLTGCAERIIDERSTRLTDEVLLRIRADFAPNADEPDVLLQFRIVVLTPTRNGIEKEEKFRSPLTQYAGPPR
jgi:hypothetical protein